MGDRSTRWAISGLVLLVIGMGLLVHFATTRSTWEEVDSRGAATAEAPAAILRTADQPYADESALAANALGNVPLAGLLLVEVALVAFHWRRSRAQKAFDPRAPLRDGLAVVFGEIESLPGHEGPVVAVRIEQHGSELAGRSPAHRWREIAREARVSPFLLRRPDGTRVRVEPSDQLTFDCNLGEIEREGPAMRFRNIVFEAGQSVHITGSLLGAGEGTAQDSAYRSHAREPVLSPPRGGHLILSTEPSGAAEEKRARFHGWLVLALTLLFALTAGGVMPGYELLAADGRVVMAEVTAKRSWKEWSAERKNEPARLVAHHLIRATMPHPDGSSTQLEAECGEALFQCIERQECARVPFLVSAHLPSVHQLGTRPTIGTFAFAFLFLLIFVLAVGYPALLLKARPWYTKAMLDEVGTGPLAE